MVSAFDLGAPLLWLTYVTIVLIFGQILLYLPTRNSRFGKFVLFFILMLAAFLAAEIVHLRDLLRVPPGDETVFVILTHVGLALFVVMMHALADFSRQVGAPAGTFGASLRLQETLCPVCRKVKLKVPLSSLIAWGLVGEDGALVPGVTLEQLVDRGYATHPSHKKTSHP